MRPLRRSRAVMTIAVGNADSFAASHMGTNRPVIIWLLVGAVMIACMVAIGGITRLTGSGLSITEWKPIMGALPPMNEQEWSLAFEKYKRIPQYTLINQQMDLQGFKRIFFWEYLHRNWGRLIGIVFMVPFLVFWKQGRLHGWLMRRLLLIVLAGGFEGAIGWFMVMSGLFEGDRVSHFRLAIHLTWAFFVFSLVLWTALDLSRGRRSLKGDGSTAAKWARWLLPLLLLQIVYGAFTAGLDAGRVANTWPLMNGRFLAEQATAYSGTIMDFVLHKEGVQFIHRNLAWLVALGCIVYGYRFRTAKALGNAGHLLALAVVLQFTLGVLTLITQVDITLGVVHQFGALLLMAALLNAVHRTGRVTAS